MNVNEWKIRFDPYMKTKLWTVVIRSFSQTSLPCVYARIVTGPFTILGLWFNGKTFSVSCKMTI